MTGENIKSITNQKADHYNHICIQPYEDGAGNTAIARNTGPLQNEQR